MELLAANTLIGGIVGLVVGLILGMSIGAKFIRRQTKRWVEVTNGYYAFCTEQESHIEELRGQNIRMTAQLVALGVDVTQLEESKNDDQD